MAQPKKPPDPPGSPGARILVVDDETAIGELVRSALEPHGYVVDTAPDGSVALGKLRREHFDAVLLDMRMPGTDGFGVLDELKTLDDPPLALVMSAFADLPSATEAMRRGAIDFIEKPFKLVDLVFRIQRALEGARSHKRIARGAIAESPRMKAVFDLADRVARAPSSSALIVGESGVGKEIIAARIHESSDRRSAPFVKVNLAAIPEAMIEAELFGSAKGAFTDSKRDRPGLLATADGGTILLDEITEFKVDLQPKLLRVLEERRYFPIGVDRERTIDVRVLAATNRNPLLAIGEGRLRADLYYRIGTVILEVPPLRDRPEDVMPLAEHFLSWFAAEFGRSIEGFSKDAIELLREHRWPGNVRELRNVVERAVIMCDARQVGTKELGLVRQPDKPQEPLRSMPPLKLSELPLELEGAKQKALASIERKQIERALKVAGGNRTTAALLLGISRSTLWEKLKIYGL